MLAHFGGQSSQLLGFRLPTLVPMLGHGVELFFVLSGYLIGGLLLDIVERSPDRRSWFIFLVRRWMRTIPLYVVWVIVLLAFSPPWGSPVRYAIRYLTFMQNVFRPMPDWFPVSWSLAIEEWFYLLFSAVAIALATRWPRRALAITCALFITLPLLGRIAFVSHVIDLDLHVRKMVLYRLDAIAYGVLAVWLHRTFPAQARRWGGLALALGVVLALTSCWLLHLPVTTMGPYLFSAVPLGFSLWIPAAARLVSCPPGRGTIVRWLSTRAYGLYIVHFTCVEMGFHARAQGLSPVPCLLISIFASLVLAEAAYRLVEVPVLLRRPPQFAPH